MLPVVIFFLKIFVAFYRKRLCHLRILQKIAPGCGEDNSFHHCHTMANINFFEIGQIEKFHDGRGKVLFRKRDSISQPSLIGWKKRHLNEIYLRNISWREEEILPEIASGD